MRMRAIRERITFFRRFPGERFKVVHLESEMSQVRPYHYRTALVELADLNFLVAPWRLEENQLRAAPGSVPARLFQSKNITVKCHGPVQIRDAIPRVQKLFDHSSLIARV